MTWDHIVVGGGVIGMLTARALRGAGAQVLLLERGQLGRASSWAGGGILSPLYPWRYPPPLSALSHASQAIWPDLAGALAAETGVDPQYRRCGLLVLEDDEQERATHWAAAMEVELQRMDAAALTALAPGVCPVPRALWLPEIAQLRPPRLMRALKLSLLLAGVRLQEQTPVQGLHVDAGRVQGVATTAGVIRAGHVIVAAGAYSGELLRSIGYPLPVTPVRGQMIRFEAPGVLDPILLHRDHYLIPRADGGVLVGSTLEQAGFDAGTTIAARTQLIAAACALLPVLGQAPVTDQWAGLRPGTADEMPYIGAVPDHPGLSTSSGHFRNGLVLAAASAQALAEELSTGRPSPLIAAFRPPVQERLIECRPGV